MPGNVRRCFALATLILLVTAGAAPADPLIEIMNPPLVVASHAIPTEHLHLKLDEPTAPEMLPAFICTPGSGGVVTFFSVITKPDGSAEPGFVGVPVPRDQLGRFELTVYCIEVSETGVTEADATVAYSVEPYAYKDYVRSAPAHEPDEHAAPVAWWRLGDLPKGTRTLADSAGDHDGVYHADGGIHPALDRDGAPNCNVLARATSGCNDRMFTGVTSELLSDHDRAVFFTPGQYAAVQDFPAPAGPYTIEAWVNPRVAGDMMIFQHGRGPALFISGGAFVFRQTATDVIQAGGEPPAAGHWSHVVGTWDGIQTARLYVDGEEVGVSTAADTPPSGAGSTLYLGNGDLAGGNTFDGSMDEVAYYDEALTAGQIALHHEIATYVQPGEDLVNPLDWPTDVTRPKLVVNVPSEGAVFNHGKVPGGDFDSSDPDGPFTPISGDEVVCVPSGLDGSVGTHTYTVTCTDRAFAGANVKQVSHDYTVGDFTDVIVNDDPIGYWRLNDLPDASVMAGFGARPDGEYKNDTTGGPTGVSGDADSSRRFLGQGGYGYVNGIEHPRWSYTMEAWVRLDDAGDAMILQHGRGGALFVKDGKVVFRQTVTDVTSTVGAAALVGGWHQVAGTWDGVYARLYVDGELQGADVYAPTPPSGFSTFYVGYGEYAPWIRGDMDEVSYYADALTPERIFEHFIADPEPGPRPQPAPGGSSVVVRTPDGRVVARVPLTARCPKRAPRPCSVTARLRAPATGRVYGSAARRLAPGRRWKVRITLRPAAARTLAARGTLRAIASVTVRRPGARPRTTTARIVLRASA